MLIDTCALRCNRTVQDCRVLLCYKHVGSEFLVLSQWLVKRLARSTERRKKTGELGYSKFIPC